MHKVDCPCRTCSHHGEPRCTHDKNCYQGEAYAAWERYHAWVKEQKYKQSDHTYHAYAEDRHTKIVRMFGK
jgi:putative ribosome biogenesis GTPase RsgA